jgi:general secretion pathway protein B
MSFILDALKKSEAERQRQSMPGLMDHGVAPRRRGLPAWAIIICVLLGVNVLILAVMLFRQQTPASPPPTAGAPSAGRAPVPPAATARAPAAQASPDAAHFSPLDNTPVYAPEIPVDEPEGAAPGATAATRAGTAGTRRAAAETSAPEDEILPEIGELNLTGAQALPDLHLDVHVYATRPADRFVYINMRKYREGAVLQEGLTLERIRRDGVVLNYDGLRFLLPRQ